MTEMRILPCGDSAVSVDMGNEIKEEINNRVMALESQLKDLAPDWLKDMIPTYRALLIGYDVELISFEEISDYLAEICSTLQGSANRNARLIEIPVCYGGEYGPDLGFVAEHNGLSSEEVIRIHSGTDYHVYMLGFVAGFPYLGGMDERIATPRLETPRTLIPGGSVGIAAKQTGLYPVASPGGWQIIGRTPLDVWDFDREDKAMAHAGDTIRFVPITEEEFIRISEEKHKTV